MLKPWLAADGDSTIRRAVTLEVPLMTASAGLRSGGMARRTTLRYTVVVGHITISSAAVPFLCWPTFMPGGPVASWTLAAWSVLVSTRGILIVARGNTTVAVLDIVMSRGEPGVMEGAACGPCVLVVDLEGIGIPAYRAPGVSLVVLGVATVSLPKLRGILGGVVKS